MYGMGATTLAQELGVDSEAAKAYILAFKAAFPKYCSERKRVLIDLQGGRFLFRMH